MFVDLTQLLVILETILLVVTLIALLHGFGDLKRQVQLVRQIGSVSALFFRKQYLTEIVHLFQSSKQYVYSCVTLAPQGDEEADEIIRHLRAASQRVEVRYLVPKQADRLKMGAINKDAGARVRYHSTLIVTDLRYTISDDQVAVLGFPGKVGENEPTVEGHIFRSEAMVRLLKDQFQRAWEEATEHDQYLGDVVSEIRKQDPSVSLRTIADHLGVSLSSLSQFDLAESKKDVKGIIFVDMDETVLDSRKTYVQTIKQISHELVSIGKSQGRDAKTEAEQILQFYNDAYIDARKRGDHRRLYDIVREYLQDRDLSDDQLEQIIKLARKPYTSEIPLKERVRETIESLHAQGFAVVLYTAGDVNKLGLNANLFDDRLTISPKTLEGLRRSFDRVISKYQVKKSNIYMVGDELATDIDFGNRLGFRTALVTSKVSNRQADGPVSADYTVSAFFQLAEIVKNNLSRDS